MTASTIRVLGCSGSIAAGSRTTSFLLDDDVLIDAGTGVGDLTLDELARIDHILISHSHLDHVLSIGLLADSVARRRVDAPPIRVHALAATLDALRQHIFNGVIWPDFTRLPSAEQPILAFEPFAIGDVLAIGERRIEVLPAIHTVPAVGLRGAGGFRRLGLHGRHRPEPGTVAAPAQPERCALGDRNRVQRRGARTGQDLQPPVPGHARPRTGSARWQRYGSHHPHQAG